MSASYPGSAKSFVSRNSGDVIQPAHVNDLQDEVNAIETGLLTGTAPLVSSNTTVNNLTVSKNSTLGSTITIGTVPYVFPTTMGSAGQTLGISSTSGAVAALAWTTGGVISLLKAGNGTDAAAGATTVDSIAITGLTANDTLRVTTNIETSSQATAQALLYHVTDAATILAIGPSPLLTGNFATGETTIRQRQGNSTAYVAVSQGMTGGIPARSDFQGVVSLTTAWTGSWTLGLRHGGVTAGGTFKWQWAVYKQAGQ